MSFESFALQNIQKRHPAVQKRGFRDLLNKLDAEFSNIDCRPGFFPDGYDYDEQKQTLTLYEIEDTWPLTEEKLGKVRLFAHDLYDASEIETTVVSTDRYGVNETVVWAISQELPGAREDTFLERNSSKRKRKFARDFEDDSFENKHRAAYSPAEFARSCGKHPSWAYRLLYAGKINAITNFGRILIPASELARILADAKPYEPPVKTVSDQRRVIRAFHDSGAAI